MRENDDVATTLAMLARGLMEKTIVCVYVNSETANELGVNNGGRLRFEIIVKEVEVAAAPPAVVVEAPAGPLH